MTSKILKLPDVVRITALSRSSLYAFVAKGLFPKPLKLGAKAVGWLEAEVTEWVADRAGERDKASSGRTNA